MTDDVLQRIAATNPVPDLEPPSIDASTMLELVRSGDARTGRAFNRRAPGWFGGFALAGALILAGIWGVARNADSDLDETPAEQTPATVVIEAARFRMSPGTVTVAALDGVTFRSDLEAEVIQDDDLVTVQSAVGIVTVFRAVSMADGTPLDSAEQITDALSCCIEPLISSTVDGAPTVRVQVVDPERFVEIQPVLTIERSGGEQTWTPGPSTQLWILEDAAGPIVISARPTDITADGPSQWELTLVDSLRFD